MQGLQADGTACLGRLEIGIGPAGHGDLISHVFLTESGRDAEAGGGAIKEWVIGDGLWRCVILVGVLGSFPGPGGQTVRSNPCTPSGMESPRRMDQDKFPTMMRQTDFGADEAAPSVGAGVVGPPFGPTQTPQHPAPTQKKKKNCGI